jgi:hypothetical protein
VNQLRASAAYASCVIAIFQTWSLFGEKIKNLAERFEKINKFVK